MGFHSIAEIDEKIIDLEDEIALNYERAPDLLDQINELREGTRNIRSTAGRDDPTIVEDDDWLDYARRYAEDTGLVEDSWRWPATHINWETAAADLQSDFQPIQIGSETYWVR
jgi:hypothetical protein